VSGIVNGVDTESFDPQIDRALPQRYGVHGAKEGKRACKQALLAEAGLDRDPSAPLFASVSRLVWQKGIDLALEIVPALVDRGARVLFVGTGEHGLEEALREAQRRYPGRVASRIAFDDALARRIFAGSDFFMVPSRFEPCGLTQMYAMRYGSVPIVTPVGGLKDTVTPLDLVHDEGTGIVSAGVDPLALLVASEDALGVYRDPVALSSLITRGMRRDSSWAGPAKQYLDLYALLGARS
jgi:starch synthase